MSLAFLPLVAAIAVMACAPKTAPPASPPGTAGSARQGPAQTQTKEIEVRVVVGPRATLEQQCTEGKFAPVDILIDEIPTENEPYHCVGRSFMLHHVVDEKFPRPEENQALVRVHRLQGQSVRWYSETAFAIVAIKPHVDKLPGDAPANPFPELKIPTADSKSILSGPLSEQFTKLQARYKMMLRIGKRNIDPDVWCQP